MQVYPDHIPRELKVLESFILWENFNRGDGKMSKTPVSSSGFRIAHNNPDVLMPFESAKEKLSKGKDVGLGIGLLDGLKVRVEADEGYLWCLDFDGFADSVSNGVDDGVMAFVDTFPSYTEISPSGTGFKYFFVCDRVPQSKYKIKFGPSEFAEKYPDVTKYVHREIEVFSRKGFLTLTGQLFSPSTGAIKFLSSAGLDNALEHLNNWATNTGGSGSTASSNPCQKPVSTSTNTSYSKLSKSSLEVVLAYVDPVDEQIWSDTANVLARVYGDAGWGYFQSYSKGDYCGVAYDGYTESGCEARFDRALNELKGKPDGYGISHLLSLSRTHPDWQNPKLEYEEVNPFEALVPEIGMFEPTTAVVGAPEGLNTHIVAADKQVVEVNGLLILQARFALSEIGGELRVIDLEQVAEIQDGRGDTNLNLYKLSDAKILMRRHLQGRSIITTENDDVKNFFIQRTTQAFRKICFRPGESSNSELNLWAEPPIRPQKGDWSLIKSHIYTIICDSDVKKYEYLIGFLAHMLQCPKEKPGVMIVLRSGQGTGKGALFQVIQRIWQATTLFASQIDSVIGQFNSALERSYVVLLDEALFSGDRKAQDQMKSLITEPICRVEAKYQPSRQVASIHRFFATTNHEQFGSTASDDRRHAFFEVSDCKRGNAGYFSDLFRSIEDDSTISAMIYDLLRHDLTAFNVRDRPITKDRDEQVLKSLTGFKRYWYQVLYSELIDCYGDGFSEYQGDFVPSATLVGECNKALKNIIKNRSFGYVELKADLAMLCPSARTACKKPTGSTIQRRGYDLPSIDIARSEFEHALNVSVSWGDDS